MAFNNELHTFSNLSADSYSLPDPEMPIEQESSNSDLRSQVMQETQMVMARATVFNQPTNLMQLETSSAPITAEPPHSLPEEPPDTPNNSIKCCIIL